VTFPNNYYSFQENGGSVVEAHQAQFRLIDPKQIAESSELFSGSNKDVYLSSKFILDCIASGKVLDVEKYKAANLYENVPVLQRA